MNNLSSVLPKFLVESLLCSTLVNCGVVNGAPEITTSNANGYIYEVKNKKVIRSLYLNAKGIFIRCIYLLQNKALNLYYLVLTECHKLLVIRRKSFYLQIIKSYNDVKEFEVYDFKCVGFPQIKISFYNATDDLICEVPVEENTTYEAIAEEVDHPTLLVEALEQKLQILEKHVDQLSEEHSLLVKQVSSDDWPTEFGMSLVGPIGFSEPLRKNDFPPMKVSHKWIKVLGMTLIIGMKLQNSRKQEISDVELLIKHELIKDYVYRIFQPSHDLYCELFAASTAPIFIKAGEDFWVVGALNLPSFLSDATLTISCHLISGNGRKNLVKEAFEVTVLDIACRSHTLLDEQFAMEDLLAIKTAKSETRLMVRTEDMEDGAMESVVTELGFRKIKHLNNELFYCTSIYLNEVFVALKHITENPSTWKMIVFTSGDSQIYFLINSLYELLPESTVISCAE